MLRRAGEQVVVGDDPAVRDGQLAELPTLPLGHGAEPTAVRTAARRDDVTLLHVHTWYEFPAGFVIGWAADFDRSDCTPLFRGPLGPRNVPCKRN